MAQSDLLAVGILEHDNNADLLWAWTYPAVPESVRGCVERKYGELCEAAAAGPGTEEGEEGDPGAGPTGQPTGSTFARLGDMWYYLTAAPTAGNEALPRVDTVVCTTLSKDFNPEKYFALNAVFVDAYLRAGSGADVLQEYISVFVRGASKTGGFKASQHSQRVAFMSSSIKDVISKFGIESILVYTAVLLKRRIAVFDPDVQSLLEITRTLPQFAIARKDWNLVYPWMALSEMGELAERKCYIAGFTEAEVETREDLFDILVNVPAGVVTIANHATSDFALGKIHKEIAKFMVAAAADDDQSDADVVKDLMQRTSDLVGGLQKLASPSEDDPDTPVVTLEAIKSRKMQPSMHTFLYNLAQAENMLQL